MKRQFIVESGVIVQLVGTVLEPFAIEPHQDAVEFTTNSPLDATPANQLDVYELPGVVVKNASIRLRFEQPENIYS